MIEIGVDASKTDVHENAAAIIAGLLSELRRLVRKTELGIKISRESAALLELERAYFRDLLDLFFERAAEEFARLAAGLKPPGAKNQPGDDLVRQLKRSASLTVIESDLCGTVLMNDFSELMARFVAGVERNIRTPRIAA